MKKILLSLSTISAVAILAVVGTTALFSDEEKSTGNTFNAGTIDIAIDGQNPWTSNYDIGDLKPGETGYINFDITNVGQNPVNVSKNLSNFVESTGTVSEPECTDQGGVWDNSAKACDWDGSGTMEEDKNDVQTQLGYDLSVEVYDSTNAKIWWQSIYTDAEHQSLVAVYGSGQYVALGMIPVGGHMMVTQSYHFNPGAGNEYQGDDLSFDITLKGEQLTGGNGYAQVALENKTGPTAWDIIQDNIGVSLMYKTQGPLFDFILIGQAPLANHNYVLAVGYNAATDVDTQIGTGTSDNDGHIEFSGTADILGMTNAKAWLVPAENWSGGMIWTGWPTCVPNFLWETGLINYTEN